MLKNDWEKELKQKTIKYLYPGMVSFFKKVLSRQSEAPQECEGRYFMKIPKRTYKTRSIIGATKGFSEEEE